MNSKQIPVIRLLKEADANEYWQVKLRSLREDPEAFQSSFAEQQRLPLGMIRERFQKRWSAPDNYILGAFLEGRLVGVVGFFRRLGMKINHRGVIWGMYVVPERRRQGIGRALLTQVIERAKTMVGMERLNLSVMTSQVAARNLYRSVGFEPYGVEKKAVRIGDRYLDEEHLVLDLNRA